MRESGPAPKDEILVTCSCGRGYTLPEWEELLYVGKHVFPDGDVTESRQCQCMSVVSVNFWKENEEPAA
jgi:hypothetical protein